MYVFDSDCCNKVCESLSSLLHFCNASYLKPRGKILVPKSSRIRNNAKNISTSLRLHLEMVKSRCKFFSTVVLSLSFLYIHLHLFLFPRNRLPQSWWYRRVSTFYTQSQFLSIFLVQMTRIIALSFSINFWSFFITSFIIKSFLWDKLWEEEKRCVKVSACPEKDRKGFLDWMENYS